MTDSVSDPNGTAAEQLREIVANYGPKALDDPAFLARILPDLMSDQPRERRIIEAAAAAGVADRLSTRISHGTPIPAAIVDVSRILSDQHALTLGAAEWAVSAYARALGHEPPPPPAGPTLIDSPLPPHPAQPHPAQPQPAQPQPAQPQPAQPQPAQPQPAQPQPAQPQPAQPQPAQPQPAQPQFAQPQPMQPHPQPAPPHLAQRVQPQPAPPQHRPPPPQPQPAQPQRVMPPMAQQPMAQQPMAQQPMAQQPMAQQPIAQPMPPMPVAQQPMAQQSMAQQPHWQTHQTAQPLPVPYSAQPAWSQPVEPTRSRTGKLLLMVGLPVFLVLAGICGVVVVKFMTTGTDCVVGRWDMTSSTQSWAPSGTVRYTGGGKFTVVYNSDGTGAMINDQVEYDLGGGRREAHTGTLTYRYTASGEDVTYSSVKGSMTTVFSEQGKPDQTTTSQDGPLTADKLSCYDNQLVLTGSGSSRNPDGTESTYTYRQEFARV